MEAYTSFAEVYDLFMDNVPYQEWSLYIKEQLHKANITSGILLDLGCGTGELTRKMADFGYDMIGVDNSYEMLDIAKAKSKEEILYLLQDMREFELYGTVAAAYCACDCLNYILEEEELLTVFSLVNNYLDPGGLFIFDINTPYKYEVLMGEQTFAENRENGSFIWENYYDEEEQINEYDLTLFIREEDGKFARFEEVHYQRCYQIDTVKELIKKAGMELVAIYDGYTNDDYHSQSEKVTFIAKEVTKKGN